MSKRLYIDWKGLFICFYCFFFKKMNQLFSFHISLLFYDLEERKKTTQRLSFCGLRFSWLERFTVCFITACCMFSAMTYHVNFFCAAVISIFPKVTVIYFTKNVLFQR